MAHSLTPAEGAAQQTLEDIEIRLLLEGIAMHYGYDLRDYSPDPLRRGIIVSMAVEGLSSISRYQDRLLHDPESLDRFLDAVAIQSTTMFREAEALHYLRSEIAPWLRTFPSARMWVAGCATGEEVVSLAIVLRECGLLHRVRIYATDISDRSLDTARMRAYPLENVRACEQDYVRSGGTGSLSDYYTATGDLARFDPILFTNVTWARHNLATDSSFNDFHAVFCTGPLARYSSGLQRRVHRLLRESLIAGGYLILGAAGSEVVSRRDDYEWVLGHTGLYRKARR